jgi:NAD(P)H dehydrogenase (quinone)
VADEASPASLVRGLAGVERLLLVGSPFVGPAARQPVAWVDAARTAGVGRVVYTSVLHADASSVPVAAGHRALEAALRIAGVPHAVLRLGACVEDYTVHVPAALEYQAVLGCAGTGFISCASRGDYADAIAAVLLEGPSQPRVVHELAGGSSFTLPELAAEIGRQCGAAIRYVHLPAALYRAALLDAGVPPQEAQQVVDADLAAPHGALLGYERELERLIGRRAMGLQEAVALALEGCRARAAAAACADAVDVDVFA